MVRAIAMVLAAGAALAPVGAEAQAQDKCYGVARAGEGSVDGGGASRVDYQGDAWVMVPAGTCMTMALPVQPDGTPRRGALQPLDRDPG